MLNPYCNQAQSLNQIIINYTEEVKGYNKDLALFNSNNTLDTLPGLNSSYTTYENGTDMYFLSGDAGRGPLLYKNVAFKIPQ